MISVITPVKNIIRDGREPYFRRMMDTLHGQSFRDIEHIVIDGASVDGTLNLLCEYLDKKRIQRIISEHDTTLYHALNRGITMASGDYIHIMNTDDYFSTKYFFEISLRELERHHADFTHGDRAIFTRDGRFVSRKRGDERTAYFRMPFRHQTMLVRRSVYDRVGQFDENYTIAADYKFVLQMLQKGIQGHYLPYVFIHSYDGGITSDRATVVREVTRVLYEHYGHKYGLDNEECRQIYLQHFTEPLMAKIGRNIPDEMTRASLLYGWEQSHPGQEGSTRQHKEIGP